MMSAGVCDVGAASSVVRRPHQTQDRPLGSLIELVPHGLDPLVRPRFGADGSVAERPREHPTRRRAHQALADERNAPPLHQPRPPEPVEQRRRVQHDEPLDPLGVAMGEREADGGAPVVGDQLDRANVHLGQEPLHEPREPRERVVEVAALPGASEPDQIGRDPTASWRGTRPSRPSSSESRGGTEPAGPASPRSGRRRATRRG